MGCPSGCVDADLMGSAGLQRGLEQTHPARLCQSGEPRGGGLAVYGGAPDAVGARVACDNRVVAALDCPGLKPSGNRRVDPLIEGEQHQSTRGRIEAMVESNGKAGREE